MAFERYLTEVPWWATSLQAVESVYGEKRKESFNISLAHPPAFVIANLSVTGGQRPLWQIGALRLHAGGETWRGGKDFEKSSYVNEQSTLFILNGIEHRKWQIDLEPEGILPLELNFMGFHPAARKAGAKLQMPPTPSGHCRMCKITTKALALAIVAAATLPALPAALITAVASYLGVSVAIAAAFIGSVLGDTADVVAEKLCTMVGICP